jgi:uncharacterized phage protein gp47/JayE
MLNLPSLKDIVNSIRTDITGSLPSLDPTIFGSFIRGIVDSLAGRAYDLVELIKQLVLQLFPQTAEGEALQRWAAYENIDEFPATASSGNATATGTATTNIPIDTSFRAENGELYTSTQDATIAAVILSVTSITRSGTIATVTTATAHGLASNIDVTIAGAVETDYNGTFTITVLSDSTFSYTVTGSPSTPATGTITASASIATVPMESDNEGLVTNLDSGALLTLTSPIAGVDSIAYVQFEGFTGGQDTESSASLLSRTLQSRSNPVANFNVGAIEKVALAVQGVTRVKVKRITPAVGDVTILFVRDNDDNIIPSASEVAEVRAAILELLPANSDESDVYVIAPTPITTNYTFSTIVPNTSTMQDAIRQSLIAFYEDEVTFETNITEDKYRSAIIDTIDPITGDTLSSFTLTDPINDITVTTNEIGVLGNVTF